ncbi:MAG: YIP1 family protein [Chloroflexi bacterium]|nr:YIP1 family protein [Chloroflexota bacterium]MBU1752036.1 YIP1 family protein [Chloroflexota bacterium]
MNVLTMCVNALFLRPDAYARMRETKKALLTGLILIIVLALLISVLALVGDVVEVATGPDLGAIKDVVWRGMVTSSWWRQIPPEGRQQAQQMYDLGWQLFPQMFGAPQPVNKAVDLIARPLIWLADWLIYGLIAFALAKFVFKGEGKLPIFLGVLALAAMPQVFELLQILPAVEIDGLLITLWSLCCAYLAIKVSFDLPVTKAFWTTLLTWLLALIPFALVSGFFGLITSGIQMVLSGLGS